MFDLLADIRADKAGDKEGGGSIDKLDFLQYMLVRLGKVSQDDLDKILGMFDDLDEDGSGRLDEEDVRMYARKKGNLGAAGHGGSPAVKVDAVESQPLPRAFLEEDTAAPSAAPLGFGNLFGALKKPLLS